jgi:hypothetical protein
MWLRAAHTSIFRALSTLMSTHGAHPIPGRLAHHQLVCIVLLVSKGRTHEGRCTDGYQHRDGQWLCIGANVITENVAA